MGRIPGAQPRINKVVVASLESVTGRARNYMNQQPTPLDYEGLLVRCLGNMEFALRVLSRFEDRLDADLTELEQHAFSGDMKTVAAVAHRIRGASANVSATRLQATAADLENAAKSGQAENEDIESILKKIKEERFLFSQAVAGRLVSGNTP